MNGDCYQAGVLGVRLRLCLHRDLDLSLHDFSAFSQHQVVEIASRTSLENRKHDARGDFFRCFFGFGPARVVGQVGILIAGNQDDGIRVLFPDRLADCRQPATIKRDNNRVSDRFIDSRAGGVAFGQNNDAGIDVANDVATGLQLGNPC